MDFFVSYTRADQAWAEWIAWVLEEDGHRVVVQAWDFVPGTNWVQSMQTGVTGAARTVAVLSDDYLASVYGGAEWQAAWAADPTGKDRKLLPVRVTDCDRPGLLGGIVGVDLFGIDEAQATARLRQMAAQALAGHARPGTRPPFPTGRAARAARFPGAVPAIWNVPARNPNFTGRDQALLAVRESLATNATVTVQSVRGLGGVGKTQLANEYAHRRATDYHLVWWIAAEEPALIPDQFAALVARLGRDPDLDPDALRSMTHEELRHVPGWLLVFDNADSVDDIRPWLPTAPLPPGVPGHVIVTTRRGGFTAIGRVHDLDVVDQDEAVRLMRSRVPDLEHDVAVRIAAELGRLPLALEQAAAYLDRTGMPAADYLGLLRTRAQDLYRRGKVAGHDETVATLWSLSLDRVAADSPAASQLLAVCAYLAPVPIPLDLFTAHPAHLPEPLASTVADPLAFADALAVVVDYSLAKRTPAGLQLHRLVQGALRLRFPPEGHGETTPHGTGPLAVALDLLGADTPARVMAAPESWPRWAVVLPHVLAATEHVDGPRSPLAAACSMLLDTAAVYLQEHGRFSDARPLAERALAIDEALYGPDHPDVGTALNNLAVVLRDLGDPRAARPLAERALAIAVAVYGPDHPDVGAGLNNLGIIQRRLDEPLIARALTERALAVFEAALGPDHPNVGSALTNLAMILDSLGDPRAARPLAERALAIAEASHGPGHPHVGTDLNNLAMILGDLGEPLTARPLSERALAITETIYGPDHPYVGTAMRNLSLILRDLGDLPAARSLAERALAITETALGPGHPDVAERRRHLATIRLELGDAENR